MSRGLTKFLIAPRAVLVAWVVLVAIAGPGCQSLRVGSAPGRPRLVVLVVVDQLRPDRLSAAQPDGLGRLVREGRWLTAARIDHALTETCPGHASATTGRHPRRHGIPSNHFFVAEASVAGASSEGAPARTYCVEDETALGELVVAGLAVAGTGERADETSEDRRAGRSPALLRTDGLSDWLVAADPTARVHAVGGKDRSAILLGGRGAHGAWWLDWDHGAALATSRYYLDSPLDPAREPSAIGGPSAAGLPEWAAAWDAERVLKGVPRRWIHPARDPTGRTRDDDHPAEDPRGSRTSPHPLPHPDDPSISRDRLAESPYADRIVLEIALELVDRERLGGRGGRRDRSVDLLAVGLSATDSIGHLYGPWSQEARAALNDLDEALGAFLEALEARVGVGRVGVVLTSDHGVLPLPEWVQAVDLPENDCPVAGGRVSARALLARAREAATAALGSEGGERGPWVVGSGSQLVVNRARLEATGGSPEALVAAVQDALRREPGVARVWSRAEIEGEARTHDETVDETESETADAADAATQRLLRRSLAPGRSPDLVIVPERGCLLTNRAFGTSHGSPHDYDRRIPLLFWGPGVAPGRDDRPARLVDLAPTVAGWLGIAVPDDLDGEALPLR